MFSPFSLVPAPAHGFHLVFALTQFTSIFPSQLTEIIQSAPQIAYSQILLQNPLFHYISGNVNWSFTFIQTPFHGR